MKVNSIVKMNLQKMKQLTAAHVKALEMTAEALHTEVVQAQVIPKDTGNLQNEGTFVDYTDSAIGKVSLISNTPYARRLFYHPEFNFSTDDNVNARGHWYEDWLTGKEKDFAKNTYKKFYLQLGGV